MYLNNVLFFVFLSVFTLSCMAQQTFTTLVPKDESFVVAKPDKEALSRYQKAAAYSEKSEGYAVLILKNDKIVFEEYQNGHTAETPSHLFSGTKSFAGVLAMAAVADQLISLDEKVADTLTEFQDDPRKSKITVRHLLQFTSGIKQNFWWLTMDGMRPPRRQRVKDKYKYALTLDCTTEPGSVYEYGSSHLMVFGAFIKRKLQENPLEYLQRRIFDPIGFRYAGWHKDPEGNPALPYGAWTTAREWAKFGMFVKNDGLFRGKQIIPKGLLKQCLGGSTAMPAYGLTFWLNKAVPENVRGNLLPQLRSSASKGNALYPGGPQDLYVAAGHKGNRLYIFPSQDLLIVRLGNQNKGFSDEEFLRYFLK